MKDNVKIKTYESGARVITETDKKSPYLAFAVYVLAGSTNEEIGEYGVAHFLEHMMFKSSKNYKTEEISEKLESLGARINAWTSRTTTCYHFRCLNECFEKCAEIYGDMLQNPLFLQEEFDKEKNVILQEIAAGEDDAEHLIYLKTINAFNSHFCHNPHNVAATVDDVKILTTENLRNFMNKYYVGKNVIFSVVGNIEASEAEKIIEKHFATFLNKTAEEDEEERDKDINPESNIVNIEKDTKQAKLYILTKTIDMYNEGRFALKVFNRIFGGGMSSRLSVKVREENGLAYSIYSFYTLQRSEGCFGIYAGVAPENLEKALSEIKAVLKNVAENGVSDEELEKAKMQILSSYAFSLENKALIAEDNADQLKNRGFIVSDQEILDKYKAVTKQQVQNIAKQIFEESIKVIGVAGHNIDSKILENYVN